MSSRKASKKTPVVPVNIQKALKSNQRRLEAIEQRKKEKLDAKKLNSQAKHIVFDSGDEDDIAPVIDKGLMLFDSDSDEENKETSSLNVKDYFEGKSGEKLFRLQQKIGTDERFKLDNKFLDKDSTDEERISENEEDRNLIREREKTLKIIDNILGNTSTLRTKPTSGPLTSDLFIPRYDPDREPEEEPQQKLEKEQGEDKKCESQAQVSESACGPEPTATPPPVTACSKERFYMVSKDLNKKFDGSTFKFNFVTDAPESPNAEAVKDTTVEAVELPRKKRKLVNPLADHDSSASISPSEDEKEKCASEDEKEQCAIHRRPRKLFFYFPNDSELRNGLDNTSFFRTKGADELMQGWPEKRTAFKNSCRKVRKEATRKNQKDSL